MAMEQFVQPDYWKKNPEAGVMIMGAGGSCISMCSYYMRMKEVSPQTEIRCYKGYAHAYLACFEQQKWIGEVSKWLKMEV